MLHASSADAPIAARRLSSFGWRSLWGSLTESESPNARPRGNSKSHDRLPRTACAWMVAATILCGSTSLDAAGPTSRNSAQTTTDAAVDSSITVDVLEHGTSSRRVKREALPQLPLDHLTRDARAVAESVLGDLSLFRRLPVVGLDADPRLLRFFTDHPEVAVGVWRAMGITSLSMTPKGLNEYESDSGDGSVGLITVLYSDVRQQLVHCEGMFKSPVLAKPIRARALMHLQTESRVTPSGATHLTCRADVFVSFPSTTIETVARVVSPVSNRIADRNFEEVAMFIRMMHVAMTQQPGWVEQIARQMDGVTQQRKEEMLDLMARVYVDARRRAVGIQSQILTPESLRLPISREPEVSTELKLFDGPAEADIRTALQSTSSPGMVR